MQKKALVLIAITSLFLLGGCGKREGGNTVNKNANVTFSSTTEENSAVLGYQEDVKSFTKLSTSEFKKKLEQPKPFTIYIGKASCEYCQAFVPKLKLTAKKNPQTIYYLDVEDADTNVEIKELLVSLELEYVPALLKIKDSGNSVQSYDKEKDELDVFLKSN